MITMSETDENKFMSQIGTTGIKFLSLLTCEVISGRRPLTFDPDQDRGAGGAVQHGVVESVGGDAGVATGVLRSDSGGTRQVIGS